MKDKLIEVLLGSGKDKDLLEELQSLINEFPKQSLQYKVLCNLYAYLKHIQDNEVNMIDDISNSFTPMAAASLRAAGFIGDSAREENIVAIILQSAEIAWVVNREMAKSILN